LFLVRNPVSPAAETVDPFGNRTSKKVNGTLTTFLLDGESVVSEVTGTTTVNTLQSPVIDQPLARNGRFFAANELGSTTMLTDAAGGVVQSYDYSPFGETSQSTGEANPFQYAGRENDGTGLYYNRHRYYVPEWGRFMSEDPLGFAAGLNRYVYADNNPLGASDPSGLDWLNNVANLAAGWGDRLTGGVTRIIRRLLGVDDVVDTSSGYYFAGEIIGMIHAEALKLPPEELGSLGPELEPIDLGRKLDYIFGLATGSAHNVERSQQMLKQLTSIGLPDTPANRAYLASQLEAAYRDPSSLLRIQSDGRAVRDSLLMGPYGGLKMESIWEGPKLITVNLFGG
jgi:RHS repeat-associated protein